MTTEYDTKTTSLKLNLFENACDSLSEAISKYKSSLEGNERDLKHAVLYLSHFVELFLKEYVARQHHLLIFTRPSQSMDKEYIKTITINDAINILNKCKIEIKKPLYKDIIKLSIKRNQITHYDFSISLDEFIKVISRLLVDIIRFDKDNLDLDINKHINEDVWRVIAKNVDTQNQKLDAAENEAEKRRDWSGYDTIEECPKCFHWTVYCSEEGDAIKCTFCNYASMAFECCECEKYIPADDFYSEEICNSCAYESARADALYD